jgi:hypothetical protein
METQTTTLASLYTQSDLGITITIPEDTGLHSKKP